MTTVSRPLTSAQAAAALALTTALPFQAAHAELPSDGRGCLWMPANGRSAA